jgi:alkylation response protein AidB-like acyl-CoA dehydrogenase
MDFTEADRLAEFRSTAREWGERYLKAAWAEFEHETGSHHCRELHAILAAQGLLGAGWPKEYGGTDVNPDLSAAIFQEIANFGMRMDGWTTTDMVCHTLLQCASEEIKHDIVGRALRGEVVIVLGYTEPGSGSDAAAAKMKAERQGDDWVLNGSKMFTSTAHEASHVFLLTRTSTTGPKHAGLTMFLAPLSADGVSIEPIYTMGGQRTNATYYSDVRVPDSMRVGEVGGGWGVMRTALVFERGVDTVGSGLTLVDELAVWAQSAHDDDGGTLFDDPAVQETLAKCALEEEMARVLWARVRYISDTGGLFGVEGSMAKLWTTEAEQRRASSIVDLIGPDALVKAPNGPLHGAVESAFRASPIGTIYGGASEILRDIIAGGRLGLPRSRPGK